MPVNVPNSLAYYMQLGNHIVALREALADVVQDATYLNDMGGSAFLQAQFQTDQPTADNIAAVIGAATATNATVQAVEAFITAATFVTGGN